MRAALGVGLAVLATVGLLSTLGGSAGKDTGTPAGDETVKRPRFEVPATYDNRTGWDIPGVSPEYAIAETTGTVAYLADAGDGRFRVRAVDVASGKPRWTGPAWAPASVSGTRPGLLSLAKGGRQFFATWSFGDVDNSVLSRPDRVVYLDVYDAAYGTRRHLEIPWTEAPDVTAGGPGILIGRGSDHPAVVDPVTGEVTRTAAKDLKYPKGCASCHRDTEVRGLTDQGMLVRGDKGFWVRGAWYSGKVAPKGTDAASGVPTSVNADRVLAKWSKKSGSKGAKDLETWAVHDAATGKVLATVDCHQPAIEPGQYPEMAVSFSGRFLVAGPVAFDLDAKKGHCFEDEKTARPLTLVSVTDDGMAYGATGSRSIADVLAGRGGPVEASLLTGVTVRLAPTAIIPVADLGGFGVFDYTDGRDVQHIVGYPRRSG